MFKPPKMPSPSAPPPPPTQDDAIANQERDDRMRARKGRVSTMVSNEAGRAAGGVATKVLTGQGG